MTNNYIQFRKFTVGKSNFGFSIKEGSVSICSQNGGHLGRVQTLSHFEKSGTEMIPSPYAFCQYLMIINHTVGKCTKQKIGRSVACNISNCVVGLECELDGKKIVAWDKGVLK